MDPPYIFMIIHFYLISPAKGIKNACSDILPAISPSIRKCIPKDSRLIKKEYQYSTKTAAA